MISTYIHRTPIFILVKYSEKLLQNPKIDKNHLNITF